MAVKPASLNFPYLKSEKRCFIQKAVFYEFTQYLHRISSKKCGIMRLYQNVECFHSARCLQSVILILRYFFGYSWEVQCLPFSVVTVFYRERELQFKKDLDTSFDEKITVNSRPISLPFSSPTYFFIIATLKQKDALSTTFT